MTRTGVDPAMREMQILCELHAESGCFLRVFSKRNDTTGRERLFPRAPKQNAGEMAGDEELPKY